MGGDPTLDPVLNPDDAIVDVVDTIARGIDTMGQRGFDLGPVLRMNTGYPDIQRDRPIRGQAPHGP